jgi:tetratricopeptide (TPR) repeat protein
MTLKSKHIFLLLVLVFFSHTFATDSAASIKDAKIDFSNQRFDDARDKLIDIVRSSQGENKQEALFLLAQLKRSPDEAEIIYQEVIDSDPEGYWAQSSFLELAKIQYAIGNYQDAYQLLLNSFACDDSQEACYFRGLSALLIKNTTRARNDLESIKRGKYRIWADLALAELEIEENDADSACRRYQTLANARINPVAIYRYAECLERKGETDRAATTFREIIYSFKNAPEAVLATEKLKILTNPKIFESVEPESIEDAPKITSGFTLQFGSFQDRRNAITLAQVLKQQLSSVRIDSDIVNYREVHRVRYGFYRTREEAQQIAEQIRSTMDTECTIMKIP